MSELFRLRTSQFDSEIRNLIRETQKDAGEVLRQEAKLFVQEAVHLTPPFGESPSTESYNAQRKIGLAAVERDIKAAMRAVDDLKFIDKLKKKRLRDRIEKLIHEGNVEGVNAIFKKMKSRYRLATIMQDADPDLHERYRDRRGRVQNKRTINIVLRGSSLRRYIREKQKDVGRAKGGWVKAAQGLGVRLPAWITRHSEPGEFQDHSRDPNPRIKVGNLVRFIQETGADLRIVNRALQSRIRNIRTKLERIMNKRRR
jgi:hypothetical protein